MNKSNLLKCICVTLFFIVSVVTVFSQNNPGDVWIVSPQPVLVGQPFFIEVHVNSGTQKMAAYGFDITHSTNIMQLNTSIGTSGQEAVAPYGFLSAMSPLPPGALKCTGFKIEGSGPAGDMHFLNINFNATAVGTGSIEISVATMTNENYEYIGTPRGIGNTIIIVPSLLPGDVDASGLVNIVDALVVAQYSATVKKTIRLNPAVADVNSNGIIDIVDALIIAQYTVGIVTRLPL